MPPQPGQEPLATPRIAATTKPGKYTTLPRHDEYSFSPDAAMVYYCENETINGIEYPLEQSSPFAFPFDKIPEGVPLVGDYSSSFISRPIPHLERHAIIHAGVQKNLGPAGVTVIIVRNDYLVDTTEAMKLGGIPPVPIQNEYKVLSDNRSLYNTPPVFAIYVSALVLEYLLGKGGIEYLEQTNREKARFLYEALAKAEEEGKVRLVVREHDARSWMNVVWEMVGDGANEKFLKGADAKGFRQLKGHRSVGGESRPDRCVRGVLTSRNPG
jgi:phosphoserine aminotransferase